MSFKKLLLASAIAAVSVSSYAMEAMDDSSLSSTTGQDGIDITLSTKLTGLGLYLHDTDGFTGYTSPGAMMITGISLDNGAGANAGLKVAIDAGSTAACAAVNCSVLQVAVSTTTTTALNLGNISVAKSNRPATWGVVAGTQTSTLVSLGTLQFNATANLLNIQMGGNAALDVTQGAWMKLGATFTGGLTLTGFTLSDTGGTSSGGGIKTTLSMADNGGANLTTDVKVDATTGGLLLTLSQLGHSSNGMDVRMAGLILGNTAGATKIGDVEIVGLNLTNTVVTVVGH